MPRYFFVDTPDGIFQLFYRAAAADRDCGKFTLADIIEQKMAVSYTHLDVYKRQSGYETAGTNYQFVILAFAAFKRFSVHKADVYKRQTLTMAPWLTASGSSPSSSGCTSPMRYGSSF